MLIRMRWQMSGGRHDDRPWPPAGVPFEVPDWEGESLVLGGMAVQDPGPPPGVTDQPPPAGDTETEPAEEPPVAEAVAEGGTGTGGEAEGAGAAEPDPDPPPPGPAAPKQAWIDYAVSRGASVAEAGAMTKIDLMSRYGGRL